MTSHTVILGKITAVQGVRGWLKVFSDTRPSLNIFEYQPWTLKRNTSEMQTVRVVDHQQAGKKLLAKFDGVDDRDAAQALVGFDITVDVAVLPKLENEYYWRDLIGLTVRNTQGVELGNIIELMETGSNDVLIVKDREGKSLAIPWLTEVVIEVDIDQSMILVDWEAIE